MPPLSAVRQTSGRGVFVLALALACATPTPRGAGVVGARPQAAPGDACSEGVCVWIERHLAGLSLVAQNNRHFDAWVRLEQAALENLTPLPSLPFDAQLPPRSRRALLALRSLHPGEPWSGSFASYRVTIGDPRARHDERARYRLPFADGAGRLLSQGVGGSFSHGERQRYAFDFPMPEGSRVLAARAGTVALVRDRFEAGGVESELLSRANAVVIRHDDGTFASYAHLRAGGAAVREGERVAAGRLLGFSGNTGYSRGPHLHFCVWKASALDGEPETLPIRFDDGSREGFVPVAGGRYAPPRTLLD